MPRLSSTLFCLLFILACSGLPLSAQEPPNTPNVFTSGSMTDFTEQPNPWGGVDAAGNIRGLTANQLAVDDSGRIAGVPFSSSVALGDLNGDGLQDLVVADPKGFLWFYPNSGTKNQPKFTGGEIMPIWLGALPELHPGEDEVNVDRNIGSWSDHLVPRIQLVDFDGDGKLDIVAGTFPGMLFYLHNAGSSTAPNFVLVKDMKDLKTIQFRTDGRLDCNFLSPFLYDWYGSRRLDLIRGDGTYAANSIYLFPNKGSSVMPNFNEATQIKIIAGMGREMLTPQVIDWNNDGKPDIITGERTGQIELFLNTSTDPANPTFDGGQKLKFASANTFGKFTTVTTGNLSGNPNAPDIVFSNDTCEIFYNRNTGTPGAPKFIFPPTPIKGVNPYPNILVSSSWALGWYDIHYPYALHGWSEGPPYGVPYEILSVTNDQKEQGFAPPQGVTWKNALEYQVIPHNGTYFKDTYYPAIENEAEQHALAYTKYTNLESESHYQFSYWIKGEGVHDAYFQFHGVQFKSPGSRDHVHVRMTKPVNISSDWNHVVEDLSWPTVYGKKHDKADFTFNLYFYGQGKLYLADVQMHKTD